jgi:hypothetical protein
MGKFQEKMVCLPQTAIFDPIFHLTRTTNGVSATETGRN